MYLDVFALYVLIPESISEILQARILEWVAFSFSRGSSQLRDRTQVYPHCRRILYQLSHKGSPREAQSQSLHERILKLKILVLSLSPPIS